MYKTDPKESPQPTDNPPRKSATIVTTTGGGTYYSADCPHCSKSMPVGKDLSIMFSCCNSCGKSFDLRYTNDSEIKVDGCDKPVDKYGMEFCSKCGADLDKCGDCTGHNYNKNDEPLQDSLRATQPSDGDDETPAVTDGQRKPDGGSSKPFNPPPAKPFMKDYPRGDPRRGPKNWPVHYGGRHS